MFLEKRNSVERDRCAIQASVRIAGRDATRPCMVTDLSEMGAGLTLDESIELPDRFHLCLPLTEEHLDERLVELRWRQGRQAGVRFVRS